MNYIFGPVRSRRLGFSLGVDLIPYKTCSLDCLYCQLGRTTTKTIERSPYGDVDAVLAELSRALQRRQRINYITLSGSGEPTLSSNLGTIIRRIKEMSTIPVAVLTNGTLLHQDAVREELCAADLVVPSLDAVTEHIFSAVNRPHPLITVSSMIEGLRDFATMFEGQMWLEIMLLKGINDSTEELEKIKKTIAPIPCNRVQLNTLVRPAWDRSIRPLNQRELERVCQLMGGTCEIVVATDTKQNGTASDVEERIVSLIRRRPLNLPEIADSLGMPAAMVSKHLAHLEEQGRITECRYGSEPFYQPIR